jgi:two-component system, OmpR family, response regulator MprA
MYMPTVLIVDDDLKLLKMLQRTLVFEDLNVLTASNGQEALNVAHNQRPDLIILDWMMPKIDGLSALRQLRSEGSRTAVMMLTARDAIENRVEGLESGADDYLVKPFAPAELVARVHALLRRVESSPERQAASFDGIQLDPGSHQASRDDQILALTMTEFNLLHLLLRHPRQVLERGQILNEVWGYDFEGDDNVLEIYIGYLRKKLEAADHDHPQGHARLIQTVRGVGYVLREE